MLMGELNHRTQNILSVVQAVARQTLKSTSADEFQTVFSDRLMSLAASNDLLLANDWSGVDVLDLVNAQLAHLSDVIGKRLIVSGPKLRINANAAQTLGMALHELSTNSLKHGALFTANGRVDLTWKTGGEGDATRFEITWIESGLSDVKAPTRKGFGHAEKDAVVVEAGPRLRAKYAELPVGATIARLYRKGRLSCHCLSERFGQDFDVVGMHRRTPVEHGQIIGIDAPELPLSLVQEYTFAVLIAHPQHRRRVVGYGSAEFLSPRYGLKDIVRVADFLQGTSHRLAAPLHVHVEMPAVEQSHAHPEGSQFPQRIGKARRLLLGQPFQPSRNIQDVRTQHALRLRAAGPGRSGLQGPYKAAHSPNQIRTADRPELRQRHNVIQMIEVPRCTDAIPAY